MSESLTQTNEIGMRAVAKVILKGDLSDLTDSERVYYIQTLCQSLHLNPLSNPFNLLKMKDGKVVAYANKNCTAQLSKLHGISIYKIERETQGDHCVVTAYARDMNGLENSDIGVVYIKGLMAEDFSNALMRATTKAKRRVILSICGLGMLDESEIETIAGAMPLIEADIIAKEKKPSSLHNWACGYDLAKQIVDICAALKRLHVEENEIKKSLPEGVSTRKDLTENQAITFLQALREFYARVEAGFERAKR